MHKCFVHDSSIEKIIFTDRSKKVAFVFKWRVSFVTLGLKITAVRKTVQYYHGFRKEKEKRKGNLRDVQGQNHA